MVIITTAKWGDLGRSLTKVSVILYNYLSPTYLLTHNIRLRRALQNRDRGVLDWGELPEWVNEKVQIVRGLSAIASLFGVRRCPGWLF